MSPKSHTASHCTPQARAWAWKSAAIFSLTLRPRLLCSCRLPDTRGAGAAGARGARMRGRKSSEEAGLLVKSPASQLTAGLHALDQPPQPTHPLATGLRHPLGPWPAPCSPQGLGQCRASRAVCRDSVTLSKPRPACRPWPPHDHHMRRLQALPPPGLGARGPRKGGGSAAGGQGVAPWPSQFGCAGLVSRGQFTHSHSAHTQLDTAVAPPTLRACAAAAAADDSGRRRSRAAHSSRLRRHRRRRAPADR